MSSVHKFFTQQLMNWHRTVNVRSLPWKEEKDPYKIWLSETPFNFDNTDFTVLCCGSG